MNNELTNWLDGFMKVAEASGITDPEDIQRLIQFHKRAELAAKYPEQFEAGFNEVMKSAQATDTTLYSNPSGFTSEDITPDVGHHALQYGIGGAGVGGAIGGILRRLKGVTIPVAPIATGNLGPMGSTIGKFITGLAKTPHGGNIGILGAILGALYGASKGRFMTGRYGTGSDIGATPEGYLAQMAPQVSRMENMKSRLSEMLGGNSKQMTPRTWYLANQPSSF